MITRRVLIIDDEETIQTVVKFGIQMRSGWEVIAASSGAEGIRSAQVEQPDVILLDVMMPDMDGITTFRQLQGDRKTQQIPVIFLTAKAQTAEKRQFNELGVNGVITKPFNSLHLPDQIAQILSWTLPAA
jgi:two-component system, OmpR family, alkaline phosphatase synthesis response regulator PhoP